MPQHDFGGTVVAKDGILAQPGQNPVQVLAANTTLSEEDSGGTYLMDASGGDFKVSLPSPAGKSGMEFTFMCVDPSNDGTIETTGAANLLNGVAVMGGANVLAIANKKSIRFDKGAALLGDHLTFKSAAGKWVVSGIGQANACFVVA